MEFISNNEETFGVVVPMPAAPEDGKVLVWALIETEAKTAKRNKTVFMIHVLCLKYFDFLREQEGSGRIVRILEFDKF